MSDLELTMMRRVGELKAEVERLNAVIESHKDAGLRILAMLDEERRLTKHLKAEVERLTAIVGADAIDREHGMCCDASAQVQRLDTLCKQLMAQHSDISCENIMLRKAGDAMADMVDWEVPYERRKKLEADWNAAKEGKGQP
jgi:hypothetical protein